MHTTVVLPITWSHMPHCPCFPDDGVWRLSSGEVFSVYEQLFDLAAIWQEVTSSPSPQSQSGVHKDHCCNLTDLKTWHYLICFLFHFFLFSSNLSTSLNLHSLTNVSVSVRYHNQAKARISALQNMSQFSPKCKLYQAKDVLVNLPSAEKNFQPLDPLSSTNSKAVVFPAHCPHCHTVHTAHWKKCFSGPEWPHRPA